MTLPDLTGVDWTTPRPHQAAGLGGRVSASLEKIENLTAVVSGKGGVGKTNVVANLAVSCAGQGARVLVVDGDAGLANLDVLMGVVPRYSVIDVMRGRCAFDDALVRGPKGISLLPAGSGRRDLAWFENGGTARLFEMLRSHAKGFDRVLLDAGAGIGEVVVDLACAASRVWLVATPEPTSFADAYATYKTLLSRDPDTRVELVVNCARDEIEGREVHRHLERTCERFLASELPLRAVLLRDPRLVDAISRQRLLVEAYPTSPLAKRITKLAHEWMRE
ncbi:MAG: AAA family ATPase [Myxococcota bacterium]|jgi:flagellar biosynthesis protein FlhG|nr:AAA family ATPase [Myxococcota bacterium]